MMLRIRVGLLISLLFAASLTVSSSSEEERDGGDESLVPLFKDEIYSDKFERYGIRIVIIIHERYTRVGVQKNGKVEIIQHTPNSISFSPNGTALIGDLAGADNPLNPVLHLKHLLRRKFDDPEVQREIEVSPHKIVNIEGKPHIQFGDRVFSPEDLLAMFVRKVKDLAEDHFRRRIRKAKFLVPGCFGYEERQAIKEVAVSVGFEEPLPHPHHVTVLCAHNFCDDRRDGPIYLVFHLGESSCELNIWSNIIAFDYRNLLDHLASVTEEIEMKTEFLEKTARAMVERGLEMAGLNASDIGRYVLTGGGAKKPRSLFKELFEGKEAFEHEEGLDHDEALTMGAFELEKGIIKEFSLWIILPRSVGVETLGGVMTRTLARNSLTPISKTKMFTTSRDNQTAVEIRVLRGDRRLAKDCDMLARFHLKGIRAAPRGVPQIEITFSMDDNDVLTLKATEKDSNVSSQYIINEKDGWYDETSKRLEEIEDEETVYEEDRIMYLHSRMSLSSI